MLDGIDQLLLAHVYLVALGVFAGAYSNEKR
jgi:hypothetical protein